MEALTRLVTESLVRHGFDRPLDYRRLHWSHWFRCESHHSLLSVPSKPGVFAVAEEIMDFAPATAHVATGASPVPPAPSAAAPGKNPESPESTVNPESTVEERRFSAASSASKDVALAAEANTRRMLAVTQFFESDDMAFSLDRMLVQANPMRARLNSGRYFVRYVAIADESQRRSIATALNQWIVNAGEKSGIGTHFATSLELTEAQIGTDCVVTGTPARPAERSSAPPSAQNSMPAASPHLDSGAATNIHCPSPLPSGF
jgi:hypothetical protein